MRLEGKTAIVTGAARGIGARCVGVGTGSYTASDLRACGADVAFDSLADPAALHALFATRRD